MDRRDKPAKQAKDAKLQGFLQISGSGVVYLPRMVSSALEIVYVDADDTLVRSAGSKRMPIAVVVGRVRALKQAGATLYCWSTGGAEYARTSARELGLEDCFVSFLPKPTIMIDDQLPAEGGCADACVLKRGQHRYRVVKG